MTDPVLELALRVKQQGDALRERVDAEITILNRAVQKLKTMLSELEGEGGATRCFLEAASGQAGAQRAAAARLLTGISAERAKAAVVTLAGSLDQSTRLANQVHETGPPVVAVPDLPDFTAPTVADLAAVALPPPRNPAFWALLVSLTPNPWTMSDAPDQANLDGTAEQRTTVTSAVEEALREAEQ